MNRQIFIGSRIRQAREMLGMSQEELGRHYGVSDAHISRIEKGSVKLGYSDIERFGAILGQTTEWFVSDNVPATARPPAAALADLEVSINAYIPVYAEVSAGPGIEPIDYVASTRNKPAPETYRAYRVKGLCLEPEVKDGDTLIVDTALTPRHGDLIVCIIDGEASVKIYKDYGEDKWLENHHGKYRPEEVHLVGVVVESTRKRR